MAAHNKECLQSTRTLGILNKIKGTNDAMDNLLKTISTKKPKPTASSHLIQRDVLDFSRFGSHGAYTSDMGSELCCSGVGISQESARRVGTALGPLSNKKFKGMDDAMLSVQTESNSDNLIGNTNQIESSDSEEDSDNSSQKGKTPLCSGMDDSLDDLHSPVTKIILMQMSMKTGYDSSVPVIFTRLERKLLQLASIVTGVNAPHYLYKDLVAWGRDLESGNRDELVLRTKSISFHKLIKNTSEKYGIGNIFPQTQRLLLPSNNIVSVTRFDFGAQLYSLLTDQKLMQPENLIFGDDPHRRVPPPLQSHVFNDVETSKWYYETQQKVCVSPNDVLIPLILYIDKTYVRGKGAEPISVCLACCKRNIRSTPMAWRNIGMIPGKLGDLVPNMAFPVASLGEMRLNDWHYVVRHIMSGVKQLQDLGGLEWTMFGKKCTLHIPIMFIIGDIEGHDKVCSRKSGHTKLMNGVTHSCNITRSECGFVDSVCTKFQAFDIKWKQDGYQNINSSLRDKEELKTQLDDLGFYANIVNAFFDLDYGASRYGTHGACAICLLHTFKQKFPNSVLEQYFRTFGIGTNTKGALSVNKSVPKLMKLCLRQSDRTFPKLNCFTVSLLQAKFQLNANEKYARMLALSMFTMTTYGWEFSTNGPSCKHPNQNKIYKNICSKRILLVHKTMTIYKFLAQPNFPKDCFEHGHNSIKSYMSLFKEVVEWIDPTPKPKKKETKSDVKKKELFENLTVEGESVNEGLIKYEDMTTFPKFHYLKHLLDLIERFGSALNFDGGSCESNHKYLTKSPGMRTQGRLDTFDQQTAFNLSAKIVLDRACRDLDLSASYGVSMDFNSTPTTTSVPSDDESVGPGIGINKCSSHFSIVPYENGSEIKWKGGLVQPKNYFPKLARESIKEHLLVDGWESSTIEGFTCLDYFGTILRAHPSYRSGEPWYDYINVSWEDEKSDKRYICPGKICMFLNIKDHPDFVDGIWVVVHSSAVSGKYNTPTKEAKKVWTERGKSKLFQYWEMEKTCELAHVSSISDVAFVYPDFNDVNMTKRTKFIIEVKPVDSWVQLHNYSEL